MSGGFFSSNSALGGSSGSSRNLVEFRAGRMTWVKNMVHPDTRKGLLYIYQADDGLIHFCWKDRTSGTVEDDLIIFPDDCEFKKIEQCKTGRVFLLTFRSSSRRLFFWMQEPKTEKDEEYCRRVNDILNNPPSINNLGSGGRGGSGSDSGELQNMLSNMSQQQLMQLFGGVGQMGGLSSLLSMNRPSGGSNSSSRLSSTTPSRTTSASSGTTTTVTASSPSTFATPPTTTSQSATPQAPKRPSRANSKEGTTPSSGTTGSSDTSRALLSELQNYLSNLNTPPGSTPSTAGTSSRRNIDLSSAINSEPVSSILNDPNLLTALQQHLPNIDGATKPEDQVKDTLKSPQFQQALSMFSSALQSGQLGPVVSQFQLSNEVVAAAHSGDLEQFVKALEKTKDAKKEDEGGDKDEGSTATKKDAEKKKDEEDDENMQLG